MKPDISSVLDGKRQNLLEMPWEEYRAFPALNGSTIVHGRKSMLHLKHAWDNNGPDTEAMRFGRLVHCLLFEPSEVELRYWPWKGTRRGNAYDVYLARAELAGAEVVRAEGQYSLATAIELAQGFLANARVKELVAAGQAEQTVLAVELGMQCKGRLDWVSTAEHVLTDLKTTVDITPELFGKSFYRFGYDIKMGLYQRWLNRITDSQWPVEVIAIESIAPYDVAIIPIPDAVLDAGVEKGLEIIKRVNTAIETGEWPGVAGGDFLPLKVPYYEMLDDDETEAYKG